MKFLALLVSAAVVSAMAVEPRHHQGRTGGKGKNGGSAVQVTSATTATAAATNAAATGTVAAASGSTVVLKEVDGVPGNECLTFRNNGK